MFRGESLPPPCWEAESFRHFMSLLSLTSCAVGLFVRMCVICFSECSLPSAGLLHVLCVSFVFLSSVIHCHCHVLVVSVSFRTSLSDCCMFLMILFALTFVLIGSA